MLLILTSSYSGLLSLTAHCSKKFKKKKKLFNKTCVSLFHFSSHTLHLFCLFAPICFLFSLKKKFFFWVLSSPMPMPLPPFCFLFYFIFYFLRSPSTQAAASLSSNHTAKPICSSLLPLTKPTITNTHLLFFL